MSLLDYALVAVMTHVIIGLAMLAVCLGEDDLASEYHSMKAWEMCVVSSGVVLAWPVLLLWGCHLVLKGWRP